MKYSQTTSSFKKRARANADFVLCNKIKSKALSRSSSASKKIEVFCTHTLKSVRSLFLRDLNHCRVEFLKIHFSSFSSHIGTTLSSAHKNPPPKNGTKSGLLSTSFQ